MKNVFSTIIIQLIFISFYGISTAQIHKPNRGNKVVPYPYVREADLMWSKRIWRRIDLREKMNHPLYYPTTRLKDRKSMFDVIKDALIIEATLTAYDVGVLGDDDEFTNPMTITEIKALLYEVDTQYVEDPDTEELILIVQHIETMSEDIKWYDIKEEWFFDRQRSVMDVRIIGICPMKAKINDEGEFQGLQPLFWIYFPEARHVFVNNYVFNIKNDAAFLTLDDVFLKRYFSSYIIKESNVYDRSIGEYKTQLDALMEAERIKTDVLFYQEHDVWHY